jgi:hypothetical protein
MLGRQLPMYPADSGIGRGLRHPQAFALALEVVFLVSPFHVHRPLPISAHYVECRRIRQRNNMARFTCLFLRPGGRNGFLTFD